MRNPNFLFYKSYPDDNQSKSDKIEQILFSELKNTLEKLLEFIMSEQPLSNKKSDDENILVGIQRVHNIKEEENDDDLANNYEDFFIMNEVVINSYNTMKGFFLEKVVAILDETGTVATNIFVYDLFNYIDNKDFREYFHRRSLDPKYKKENEKKKEELKATRLKFPARTFGRSEIDLVIIDSWGAKSKEQRKRLNLVEQKSNVKSGSKQIAPHFTKWKDFLDEIDSFLKDKKDPLKKEQKDPLKKLFDSLKKEQINLINCLTAYVFNEDGTWAEFGSDNLRERKIEEFNGLKEIAERFKAEGKLECEGCEDKEKHAFSITLKDEDLTIQFKLVYGLDYLKELYGDRVANRGDKVLLDAFKEYLNDDFWVAYAIACKERELYNCNKKNNVFKMRDWIETNGKYIDEWEENKDKKREDINDLTRRIAEEFKKDADLGKTEIIGTADNGKINYLQKIAFIVFMAHTLLEDKKLQKRK